MGFKLGDKVVCIRHAITYEGPKLGQEYTVTAVEVNTALGPYEQVGLLELGNIGPEWYADRFVLASSLTKLERVIYNIPKEK